MMLSIERLDQRDIRQLATLSASVGWDYTAEEIATILAVGQVFGHKHEDGRLLSSAALCTFGGGELATIGMVIVHPSQQGQGLGKQITQACLAGVPEGTPTVLVATDAGVPLYERLGFVTVGTLHKVICHQYVPHVWDASDAGWEFAELRVEHLGRIVDLDAEAVGAHRRALLNARVAQMKAGVVLKNRQGAIGGFAIAVQGSENLMIGPVVAPADDLALALVDRLAEGHRGKIRMDVPSQHQRYLSGLCARGFQPVRVPPVMMLNASQPPWNQRLFAIAAQVFG